MAIGGTQGHLQLAFSTAASSSTLLKVQAQQPPLRVVRAFTSADGSALVHLHNVSGGVLGGDQLTLRVEVGPYARAQLTSTGATRIYRHRDGRQDATQITRLTVQAGGLLEYLPDLLIPFAGSRYRQVTSIDLATDAGLFYWEIVAPGRVAHGELFQYEQLRFDLDILAAGRPIALERMQLEPKLRSLSSPLRLDGYRYYSTFYACRVGLATQEWLTLEAHIGDLTRNLCAPGESVWGVSTLAAHGLVVRGAGMTSHHLMQGLVRCWQLAKCTLYQAEAILPRKIY